MKNFFAAACFLFCLVSCICCHNPGHNKAIKQNVVLIFDKTPSQVSAKPLIFTGRPGFFEKEKIIGYIDSTLQIRYFQPSSLRTDTLIIPAINGRAEVSHLYRVRETITYLFAAGDTILFRYDSLDRPIVVSLTSAQLTELYNMPFSIPGFLWKNHYALEMMLRNPEFIMIYVTAQKKGFNTAPQDLARNISENYTNLDSIEIFFTRYLDDFEARLAEWKQSGRIPEEWYKYYSDLIRLKRARNIYYREERTRLAGASDIFKDSSYLTLLNDDKLSLINNQEELTRYFLPRLYNIKTDDFTSLFDQTAASEQLSLLSKRIALFHYLEKIKLYSSSPEDHLRVEKYILLTGDSSILSQPEIRKIVVNDPKHDLILISHSGENIAFPQLLESCKGRVVYVDFWASWCAPCIQTIPASKALREEYTDKEIIFIYLAINDSMDEWKEAVLKHGLDLAGQSFFVTNANRSDFMKQIELETIPYFIIYDKHGKLVETDAPRPYDPAIKQLLDKYIELE